MPARIGFDQGNCTARDRNDLRAGQLVSSTGGYYAPGDPVRLRKYGGRTSYATLGAAAPVKSLALCQFDSGGTDALLGLTGTTIKTGTPGASGSFSNLATSLNASTALLSTTHYNNRWYLATGYDRNRVLESDGTVRFHGMIAPQSQPVATPASLTPTVGRPTRDIDTGPLSWTDRSQAYDNPTAGPLSTFSRASAAVVTASSYVATWDSFASNSGANRSLYVVWSIAGPQNYPGGSSGENPDVGQGGTANLGARVDIKLEYSTDWNTSTQTGTWNTLVSEIGIGTASLAQRVSQVAISANSNLVAVRATLTYQAGTSTVSLRIYDIKIQNAQVTAFATTVGMYYAVTEYDAAHGPLESPAGPVTALVHFQAGDSPSTANVVTLTLPSTAQNTNATHWRIYRTVDGGNAPSGLFLIGEVPIAATSFVDDFVVYGKDVLGNHFYALVTMTVDGGTLRYPRDTAPPRFDYVTYYRGSVVGITHDKPRTLFYSFAGRPESFPEIYVLDNFPFPERDVLVCAQPCGDSLLIAGKQLMMTLDDLPRVGNSGTFNAVDIRPLRGQPGVVNQNCMVSYSVSGEPRVAWVSKYGVHETNGTTSRKLSGNMAWPPTSTESGLDLAVLFYDAQIQCLILAYDSSGVGYNDRWALFHMAEDQAGADGLPKWTGPHYGPFSAMAAGIVSGAYRRWSGLGGATNQGIVYLENSGGTDASQSYSSTQLPFIVQTGRIYGPDAHDYGVYKANLRVTSLGGQTITVAWLTGRDQTGNQQSASKSVASNSQAGVDFFVGLGGEWHQPQFTHTSTALLMMTDLRFDPMPMGSSGRVA